MKPESIQPHRQNDLFGGQGEVLVYNLLGRRSMAPFEAVLACELAPSGSVGAHVQQSAHEIVVITEGVGVAHVDGEPQNLISGAVVFVPYGKQLTLKNTSDNAPLRYLIVKSNATVGID